MRRERLARFLADQAVELGRQLVDLGDVRLLAAEEVLGGRQVVETECAELRDGVGLGLAKLRLHLRSAAQASIDLDVAELLLHLRVATEPESDERQDQPDAGHGRADVERRRAEIDDAEHSGREGAAGEGEPEQHQEDPPARQRSPGRFRRDVELDRDLAGQRGAELADPGVEVAQPLRRSAG